MQKLEIIIKTTCERFHGVELICNNHESTFCNPEESCHASRRQHNLGLMKDFISGHTRGLNAGFSKILQRIVETMCIAPTEPPPKSSGRAFILSFLSTLFLLGMFTHPQTMNIAHDVISRAHVGAESLHKIATSEDDRRQAWEMATRGASWVGAIRVRYVSPILQVGVGILALLSSLVAADRLFHCYTATWWRYFSKRRALDRFKYVELEGSDEDQYPMVVIQLPMFNETDVCVHAIECAREMEWPRSKLLIQILDDSTCPETRATIEEALEVCKEQGVHTQYRWRSDRTGFKAGAMHDAMDDIVEYDYVCVFDADFSPDPDFLMKTVPWIHSNNHVGFVQARWTYINSSENLLTRVQSISLNYHIRCEQFARFSANLFFNFNGTAGIWRRTCIVDSGGWNHRTTVEDLDLSLRAHLRGWKFIFLDDVTCLNEIPAQYDAYRKQQHRWSAGPMQLWRKAMGSIWASNEIPLASKLYLNVFFFGTRMFATHLVSFFFYLLLIPLSTLCPEVVLPLWALVYTPMLVTLSTCIFTPGGIYYAIPYVLFENAMTIVKLSAMVSGLFAMENANEWVVTTKVGKWVAKRVEKARNIKLVQKVAAKVAAKAAARKKPFHAKELLMGAFFATCGLWGVFRHALFGFCIFLFAQASVFFLFGANAVDNLFRQHHHEHAA